MWKSWPTDRVMDECLVLVGHLLGKTRIEVVKIYRATRRAGFNRQELQQVLLNLIINAIQAMPEAGGWSFETSDWLQQDAAACGVVLEVQDSGPGLPAQMRERLFSPFFTTKNDGNGLGLWISQGWWSVTAEASKRTTRQKEAPCSGCVC